jgi:hypothetical protein
MVLRNITAWRHIPEHQYLSHSSSRDIINRRKETETHEQLHEGVQNTSQMSAKYFLQNYT